MVKQEPVPYYRPHKAHIRALSDIIGTQSGKQSGEPQYDSYDQDPDQDDCMILGASKIPMPLCSTSDGLIKYENDVVSGNEPFVTMVGRKNSRKIYYLYYIGAISLSIL